MVISGDDSKLNDIELPSILGFGNVFIEQPMMEIGSRAAQMLLDRINCTEMPFPQIIRLKTKLVIKD